MRRMGTIAIITLFLTAPVFVETGPFSVNADTRVVQNINLTWKYNKGDVTNAEAPDFNDNSWSVVHLPHTFEYTDYRFSSFYRGIGWYRKKVTIDAAYQGKKIFLEFEGAMSVAQVYINGTLHTTHLGGFLPFSVDITDAVTYGGENTIAVRLDNTKHKDIPPERSDDVEIDYCLFGGIYRDVNLVISDKLYIPHPFTVDDAPGGGCLSQRPPFPPQVRR